MNGLHVLIIPSEEFLPPENHLSGIFQLHQARALRDAGLRVGVISVRQAHSVLMIFRAASFRAAGRRVSNALDVMSVREMFMLLFDKILRPRRYVSIEEVYGIPVARIEGFYYLTPSPRTNHLGWIRAGSVAFDEYCARFGRPDLLHAHNADSAGLLAHHIAKRTGIPFVLTEHSTFYERGLVPRGLHPSLRRAFTAARGVAVVSPSLAVVLREKLGIPLDTARWIPNVVDPGIAGSGPHAGKKAGDQFVFLAMGNLIPIKGHAVLLEAFRRAFAGLSGISLRIGGDGPLRDSLERLARDLGIAPQVRFLGRLSREAVILELDRCDGLVVPSLYETFGVVIIEALARGKPVVSTACGGPDAFVTQGDGILVAPNDPDALADGMVALRRDYVRYRSEDLRERAILRFGPRRIAEQLQELYSEALPGHA